MELLKEDGCIGEKAFHGEKECFFQPFYNVEKKRIWGAEALFRLKDKNGNYYNMELLFSKMAPHAPQSWQKILQLCELDLSLIHIFR